MKHRTFLRVKEQRSQFWQILRLGSVLFYSLSNCATRMYFMKQLYDGCGYTDKTQGHLKTLRYSYTSLKTSSSSSFDNKEIVYYKRKEGILSYFLEYKVRMITTIQMLESLPKSIYLTYFVE